MYLPRPEGGPYEICPNGTHVAVCYRFIDLGTQRFYHSGGPIDQRKVQISWELPEQLMTEGEFAGQPFTHHQQYTWSMNANATLRKHLEGWRGVPFNDDEFGPGGCDIRDILGKACMLSIRHVSTGFRTYARLSSISRAPKGASPIGSPSNAIQYFSLDDRHVDLIGLSKLSEKLQATIRKSPEFENLMRPVAVDPRLSQRSFYYFGEAAARP